MRYHIDRCSVFQGMAVIEGWSEAGPPMVTYQGRGVVPQTSQVVERPDVAAAHGPEAVKWGFSIRAILGHGGIVHNDITLFFTNGERVDAPGLRFTPTNDNLDRMMERFRKATEAGGRALEIGSRARSGNTYRSLCAAGIEHTGIDITAGPNVDVVGDAHHLSRHVAEGFDFVFSVSVFEHLLMPWKVALEMNKVMKPGALAYIQSHPAWPLHEEPWDFWRFSENAWDGLFNKHTGFRVLDKGYDMKARLVPELASGGHLEGWDTARTFFLSACLVEKTEGPLVSWEAEAGDLYDLQYSHA